jgi:hypothetical protein
LPLLTPIDTIKAIVLDPAKLSHGRGGRSAPLPGGFDEAGPSRREWAAIDVTGRRQRDRHREAPRSVTATQLGLDGTTRKAVTDVQRAIALVDGTEKKVQGPRRGRPAGSRLAEGVASVNEARQRTTRSFVDDEAALAGGPGDRRRFFGQVSIDRFQRAVYWAEAGQKYLPPGLRPRPQAA